VLEEERRKPKTILLLPAKISVGWAVGDLFGRLVVAAGVLYVAVNIGRSPSMSDPNRARRDGNLDRAQLYLGCRLLRALAD